MSDNSSTPFNPYHKWLGIPPDECPPHHYRLLGVQTFEDDPEVIATAADRQMAHVKSFSTGPQARISQILLNELSKARVCLLNPDRKAQYDAQLERELAPPPEPTPVTIAPEVIVPEPAFTQVAVGPRPMARVRRKKRKKQNPFLLLAYPLVGFSVVGGLLYYAWTQRPDAEPVAESNPLAKASPEASSSPSSLEAAPIRPLPAEESRRTIPPRSEFSRTPTDPRRESSSPPNHNRRGQRPFPSGPAPDASGKLARGSVPSPQESERPAWIDDIPESVTLPAGDDRSLMELVSWKQELPRDLPLAIRNADYVAAGPRQLFLHEDGSSDQVREWLVYDETRATRAQIELGGDATGALPIARFVMEGRSLRFQWLAEPVESGKEIRLRHSLLALGTTSEGAQLQLRPIVYREELAYVGSLTEKLDYTLDLEELGAMPPDSGCALAISLQGFPTTRVEQGSQDSLGAESQLFLSFNSADYAGLGVYWQQKGRRLNILVSPGFRLTSSPNDLHVLSRSSLTDTEQKLTAFRRRTQKELTQRRNSRAKLDRDLAAAQRINITIPGGGTTPALIAQKKAAIAKARRNIESNNRRIDYLTKLERAIGTDTTQRVPVLRSLALQLEGRAKVKFEFYVPAGDARIVIFRNGQAPPVAAPSRRIEEESASEPRASAGWSVVFHFDSGLLNWTVDSGGKAFSGVGNTGRATIVDERYVIITNIARGPIRTLACDLESQRCLRSGHVEPERILLALKGEVDVESWQNGRLREASALAPDELATKVKEMEAYVKAKRERREAVNTSDGPVTP